MEDKKIEENKRKRYMPGRPKCHEFIYNPQDPRSMSRMVRVYVDLGGDLNKLSLVTKISWEDLLEISRSEEFVDEFKQQKKERAEIIKLVSDGSIPTAVDSLKQILRSRTINDQIRVEAAKLLFGFFSEIKTIDELEQQVNEIERKISENSEKT